MMGGGRIDPVLPFSPVLLFVPFVQTGVRVKVS